jgi:DNA helicase-2/ATP-dependent DNA helicase PcrA
LRFGRTNSQRSIEYAGNPVADWRLARDPVDKTHSFEEIGRAVRLVKLFRATDELANGLASRWRAYGTYQGASALIRRVLERDRLLGVDLTPRGCTLMNFHKSKGKEFDGVIVVERKFRGEFFNENWEGPPFTEGRRVLRVAITRARERVFILRHHDARPLVEPA